MQEENKNLKFVDFRRAVGEQYSDQRIRNAIRVLLRTPYTLPGDMRTLRYSSAWVADVRTLLENEDAGRR